MILSKSKPFLQNIKNNKFNILDSIEPFQFAMCLLSNLGSPDPVLRDELSYSILANILGKQHLLNAEHYEQMLRTSMDENHLFFKIEEVYTDSVFLRSFSILIVAIILEVDAKDKLLNTNCVHETIQVVLSYIQKEKDRRGYIDGKGWAHSVAHTADTLDACAQHPAATDVERMQIMDSIAHLATLCEPLYCEEDNRLAYPAYRIIANGQVDSTYLEKWINSVLVDDDGSPNITISHTNAEQFLRCLYFLLYWNQPQNPFLGQISQGLMKMSGFYRYGILPS